MNKQIRELAEQAGFNPYNYEGANAELFKKFAKLIVEEFRNVLSDEYRKTPLECCGHFLRADEAIAEHFYGVSE